MIEEGARRKHCHEPVPPHGGTVPPGRTTGQKCRKIRDFYLRTRPSPPCPGRLDIRLRSAPTAALSSLVSRPHWPRCAVSSVPRKAFSLRPESRTTRLPPLRKPTPLSTSYASSAHTKCTRNISPPSKADVRSNRSCYPCGKVSSVSAIQKFRLCIRLMLTVFEGEESAALVAIRAAPSRSLVVSTVEPALFCERGKFRQFADVARIVLDNERCLQIR
jgi:hypothetical protein